MAAARPQAARVSRRPLLMQGSSTSLRDYRDALVCWPRTETKRKGWPADLASSAADIARRPRVVVDVNGLPLAGVGGTADRLRLGASLDTRFSGVCRDRA